MLTWENTAFEFEEARPTLAVLPVGAIEQHSYHLPIGTDLILASELAKRIAERLEAWLLPTLPYSNSREHRGFHGALCLRPETLVHVLRDLVGSLRHYGVNRIVVVNGHGGNWILKPAIRELNF
ncbi:MAG: creatininase family protein, partial [Candidatus Poribacteria bacterium]|nr:creatininase family protein [Candidatus Poribacteria bacterium]